LVQSGEQVVPRLIEELASQDGDVRKLVVDVIAGIGCGLPREAMVAALCDTDPNVRAAAADALGVIGGEAVVAPLFACVTNVDEDQLVRFSALRALASLEAQVPAAELNGVLEDPVLCPAGYALLGHAEGEDTSECLLKGLAAKSRAGREAAMEALLRTLSRVDGGESERLIERIQAAALASDTLIPLTTERLPDADLATRLVLIQFLGLVGARESVRAILEASRDEAIAEVAQATLESMGEVAEAVVDEAWEDLDDVLRRHACRFMARTRGEVGSARILSALDGDDVELRASAARALGERGEPSALPALVRRLEVAARDDEIEAEEERAALIDALVALSGPGRAGSGSRASETVEHLAAHLEGADEDVRLAIVTVLGRLGRREDTELVISLLKDPSDRVRRVAVEALARIDADAGREFLRLALADEAAIVRIAAAASLAASSASDVVVDLERLVQDDDWRVRAATMRAIGVHCETHESCSKREHGLRLIEYGLRDEGAVAVAAVEALEHIGGDGAARVAVGLLGHPEPELVQSAVACVGRHGHSDALVELLPLVSHASWLVRAEVIQVLAERRVTQALPPILRRLETEQDSFVRQALLSGLKMLEV